MTGTAFAIVTVVVVVVTALVINAFLPESEGGGL